MLAKINNCYAKVELLDDGRVLRYCFDRDKQAALAEGYLSEIHDSIQDLKDYGFELCEPDLETMSVNDWVKDEAENKYKVLLAHGFGHSRLYIIGYFKSDGDFTENCFYTAGELKSCYFTPLPWEDNEVKEITAEQAARDLKDKYPNGVKIKVD